MCCERVLKKVASSGCRFVGGSALNVFEKCCITSLAACATGTSSGGVCWCVSRLRTTCDSCLVDIGVEGRSFVIEMAKSIFVMFALRYCKGGVSSAGRSGHGERDCRSLSVVLKRCVSCGVGVFCIILLRIYVSVDCCLLCVCMRVVFCGNCNKRVATRNVSSGSAPTGVIGVKGVENFKRRWPHVIGEGRVGVAVMSAWSEKLSGSVMIAAVLQCVVVYILSNRRAVYCGVRVCVWEPKCVYCASVGCSTRNVSCRPHLRVIVTSMCVE